jgi:hypothetical protein
VEDSRPSLNLSLNSQFLVSILSSQFLAFPPAQRYQNPVQVLPEVFFGQNSFWVYAEFLGLFPAMNEKNNTCHLEDKTTCKVLHWLLLLHIVS